MVPFLEVGGMPVLSSRGIFLSYRREDAAPYARLLQHLFRERLPDVPVFMDLDSIEAGLDFAEVIREAVDSCAVLVALIGRQWATLADEQGRRRLDDPDDLVRFEVQAALERGVRVIPVLVDGAKPLRQAQLPAGLGKLARLNALELSYGRYEYDADRLFNVIQRMLDAAFSIGAWFAERCGEVFPRRLATAGTLRQVLRYGENPHQAAAFYITGDRPGVATAVQVQGKELSYNNLNDTDAAFECVAEFDAPTVAIIKHANPCGVASAATLVEAWDWALRCDPVSAFGGIVAVNCRLDVAAAQKIATILTEVIIAPEADEAAKDVLARKRNLRLLLTGGMPDPSAAGLTFRSLSGGFLAQTRDNGGIGRQDLRVVTRRAPTEAELADLLFAFRVCKHVKSNAIVYAKNSATVGIGAGQPSRVDSARIGAWKAEAAAQAAGLEVPLTRNCVVASDAFFPFADGLEAAIAAGATAVI